MDEKNQLLDDFNLKKLDLNYFFYLILAILLLLILSFPKIYLAKHIYYKSRDISKLQVEFNTLKEENRQIAASVEAIKFKNKIADTLF